MDVCYRQEMNDLQVVQEVQLYQSLPLVQLNPEYSKGKQWIIDE